MPRPLRAAIGNDELLENYGYEPWSKGLTVQGRWTELTGTWYTSYSREIGAMRQRMLRVHRECYPDDERWRE